MTSLEKRQLGQTSIEITPIGLGVMQFAGGSGVMRMMYRGLSDEKMNGIIATALDGGINWFDTAEMYGRGRSELGLARGLKAAGRVNGDVVIATKWWPLLRTAANIRRTIDKRLLFLEGFDIDLYQIHWPFSFSSIPAQMDAMADLVEAGKIKAVGVSNFSADQMRQAHEALAARGLTLASNQVHYSLLDRSIEHNGVLATAKELGATIICYSPLDSGLLTGKFHRDPEILKKTPRGRRMRLSRRIEQSRPLIAVLEQIAETRGVTAAQVALNWLVTYHGDTVVAIPGASQARHAQESAGAMTFSLSQEELARIEQTAEQSAP